MLKGLVFDLDGVITETAGLHYECWAKVLNKKGINYSWEENKALKGLSRRKTIEEILKLKKVHWTNEEIESAMKTKNDDYVSSLVTLSQKDILPGIKELLDDAKKVGLKLAIASSSFNAPVILKAIGLFDYFNFIVNPADVKNGKPAPDIFLAAAKGIECSVEETIGFEDAIEGAKGIYDAGMYCVSINYGVEADWKKCSNQIYTTTKELKLSKIIEIFNKERGLHG